MRVVGATQEHPAIAGQHVKLEQRFVHEPVLERRGFDADTGGRAPESDRLQLRHDGRHDARCERLLDDRLVGRHPLRLDPALRGVDCEYMIE